MSGVPPPHEGIADRDPLEVVGAIEGFPEGSIAELGKEKTSKQRARSAGKPFVDGNNGPIILLDLLFPQSKGGYERNIESFFDGHGAYIACCGC